MLKKTGIIIVGLASLLGCATSREFQQLETEMAQYRAESEAREARMEEEVGRLKREIQDFRLSYNPDMEEILLENLDSIRGIYTKAQRLNRDLDEAISLMEESLEALEKELEEAQFKNVVREFDQLAGNYAEWKRINNLVLRELKDHLEEKLEELRRDYEASQETNRVQYQELQNVLSDYKLLLFRIEALEKKVDPPKGKS